MPYLNTEKKAKYNNAIIEIIKIIQDDKLNFEGNLNYIITKLIIGINPSNYKEMNGIIGAL